MLPLNKEAVTYVLEEKKTAPSLNEITCFLSRGILRVSKLFVVEDVSKLKPQSLLLRVKARDMFLR